MHHKTVVLNSIATRDLLCEMFHPVFVHLCTLKCLLKKRIIWPLQKNVISDKKKKYAHFVFSNRDLAINSFQFLLLIYTNDFIIGSTDPSL